MLRIISLLMLVASPMAAESLIATRVIRAQTLLTANDVTLVAAEISGALADPSEALGLEARVTLYPGRAIRAGDLGPPALIDRNQIVTLIYRVGGLDITTEGRALGRGGLGDAMQVMNVSSRMVLVGRVARDGSVHVGSIP
ncbi:flagellar basal body P-ring formation chaperone FlgA [Pseudorhodobacter sp.]|uniref:flagellar basal body P-ring formation chaperone FlgA n=1 Tax=Pseudorhodobacter sp. TaxID=1934400 RepID=UPI002AFDEDAE|nr:flagellar basal body P-ring formation chaperone FlgA [Pseudorhodobacter sp.]